MDAIGLLRTFLMYFGSIKKKQVEVTSLILMVNLFRSACSTTQPCSLACSHLGNNISDEYY